MSSYERRVSAAGVESHRVRFRQDGHNRAITFETEAAARSWRSVLDSLGPERALRLLDEERPVVLRTVPDQVLHYVEHQSGIEDGTRKRYRRIAERVIEPAFRGVLLSDLTRDMVSGWVNDQSAAVSGKTIANRHGLLSVALKVAMKDGLIPANPAHGIRLPKSTHQEMCFLTPVEFTRLLDMLPEHYRPLTMLLGLTGIRFGEATAITVGDFDRATASARIHRAWKYTGGRRQIGPPKSSKSTRTVAVPHAVFDALDLSRQPGEYAVLSPRGAPVSSGGYHRDAWQPTMARFVAEVGKRPRVHDLRHSWAAWAIQRGVPLPVIQRQMGHEYITTTVDTYGHLARSDFDPLVSMGVDVMAGRHPAIGA